jgi:hypothetical protein
MGRCTSAWIPFHGIPQASQPAIEPRLSLHPRIDPGPRETFSCLNPLPDPARNRPDLPPSSSLHPSSAPSAALAGSTPDGMAGGVHQGHFGGHQLPHPHCCGSVCEADTPAQTKQTGRLLLHSCNTRQADPKTLRRLRFAGVENGRWDLRSAALTDSAMPPLVTARFCWAIRLA